MAPERVIRTLVVLTPDWPLIAAGVLPTDVAVVVHANRVVATSPRARSEGIEVGQRRREAQRRSPDLFLSESDPNRDARAFAPVAAALEQFTPRIELSRPGVAAFPTLGPSRYFGGDEALAAMVSAAIDAELDALGWGGSAGIGIADGPFAAQQAAQRGVITVVPVGGSPAFLAPIGVKVLDRPELVDVLSRLGLHTLGSFAALAAGDVVGRFGVDGHAAHRLASGLDERPPATSPPPRDLHFVVELESPADRVDIATFAARGVAEALHERLSGEGFACTRVCISAETEHGECIERVWRHEAALTPAALVDRVRWQLDGWLNGPAAVRPTSGITRITLAPDELIAAGGRQLGFWGGETAVDERAARALARVQGLLGVNAVTVPDVRGGRGPSERIVRISAAAVDLGAGHSAGTSRRMGDAPWPGRVPAPSPALVPGEPVGVDVFDDTGAAVMVNGRGDISAAPASIRFAGGPDIGVAAWAGPWPLDERWWDPAQHRRRARLQVALTDDRALLLHVEHGEWSVEGFYD
ncbi:unannotated protein [freshwater metagenome]|uniref:Unannotated protein n=1 Tax=freshwater metagenome TaxID=449393 RepID=A0A6J6IRG6_9ZZZZ|nr:DNA polymerase Y family protein [Actinomycetota bacterium]